MLALGFLVKPFEVLGYLPSSRFDADEFYLASDDFLGPVLPTRSVDPWERACWTHGMATNARNHERQWMRYVVPLLACILNCSEGGVCGPMDSTSSCCIKTYVFDPARCGVTESEAAAFLTAAAAAEFAKTADLPPWKQECVDNYVACMEESWSGPCYSCLRYCEGQRKWPFETCRPRPHR